MNLWDRLTAKMSDFNASTVNCFHSETSTSFPSLLWKGLLFMD